MAPRGQPVDKMAKKLSAIPASAVSGRSTVTSNSIDNLYKTVIKAVAVVSDRPDKFKTLKHEVEKLIAQENLNVNEMKKKREDIGKMHRDTRKGKAVSFILDFVGFCSKWML